MNKYKVEYQSLITKQHLVIYMIAENEEQITEYISEHDMFHHECNLNETTITLVETFDIPYIESINIDKTKE